jgi:hypothetical protein
LSAPVIIGADSRGFAGPPRPRIGYRELSNGFAACDDPASLRAICDRLQTGTIGVFAQRWLRRLPMPLTDRTGPRIIPVSEVTSAVPPAMPPPVSADPGLRPC